MKTPSIGAWSRVTFEAVSFRFQEVDALPNGLVGSVGMRRRGVVGFCEIESPWVGRRR